MALINCPECSKTISDQSISCPSCGFPTPSEQIDNNDLLASSRQRQKNGGCSGATIFLLIIIVAIGYWLVSSYNSYTERVEEYREGQSEFHEESPQIEESVFDTPLEKIPMLLSGSSEDGRYFLISHFASHGIENVKYARRGNESDAYGEMQIDCSNNTIRKTSSDDLKALEVADLGGWYTPTPDWTDQDIINTSTLEMQVKIQPLGYLTWIIVNLGLTKTI